MAIAWRLAEDCTEGNFGDQDPPEVFMPFEQAKEMADKSKRWDALFGEGQLEKWQKSLYQPIVHANLPSQGYQSYTDPKALADALIAEGNGSA